MTIVKWSVFNCTQIAENGLDVWGGSCFVEIDNLSIRVDLSEFSFSNSRQVSSFLLQIVAFFLKIRRIDCTSV